MAGIGVGLLWFSYWWGLSGFSLIKGYNNNPLRLANPVRLATWTTRCYTGTGIFPSGDPADSGTCGGKGSGGFSPDQLHEPLKNGTCPPGMVPQATPDGSFKCRPRQFLLRPQPPGGGLT